MSDEARFQATVIELAERFGWAHNYVRPTIDPRSGKWTTATSAAGWPDLTLWKPGRFVVREVKDADTKLEDHQKELLLGLLAAGVDAGVWRPADWDTEIVPLLTGLVEPWTKDEIRARLT